MSLLYCVYILLALLMVAQVFLEHFLKSRYKGTRKQPPTKYNTSLICVMVVVVLIGLAINIYKDRKEEEQTAKQMEQVQGLTTENTKQRKAIEHFSAQVNNLEGQLDDSKKTYDTILMTLATNSPPNHALISALEHTKENYRIAETGIVDLKAWVSEFNNERQLQSLRKEKSRLDGLKAARDRIAHCLPKWEFAMMTYLNMLNAISKAGGTLSSDYKGMPSCETLNPVANTNTGWQDDSYDVAKLKLSIGTNSTWNSRCWIQRNCAGTDPTALIIECIGRHGKVYATVFSTKAFIRVSDVDDPPLGINDDNYKTNISKVLRGLIAAQVIEFTDPGK
ncbi:MAG: hypothetical protein WA117_24075 [Verrucomicrobiia bacterium]